MPANRDSKTRLNPTFGGCTHIIDKRNVRLDSEKVFPAVRNDKPILEPLHPMSGENELRRLHRATGVSEIVYPHSRGPSRSDHHQGATAFVNASTGRIASESALTDTGLKAISRDF